MHHPFSLPTPPERVCDARRSSRPPRSLPVSSSPASGVVKVAESVTRSGHFPPFSPAGLGFARYADPAWLLVDACGNTVSSRHQTD
jgi:hypothetical protein